MTPPTTTEHRTPAGGTTAELVLHARIAGHPVQLAALIGDGSWQFAGTLSFDIETGAPDLGALLQSLLTQAGLPALPPAMIPSVTVKEMTARYAAETFALAGTFEIGAGRGPLRVLFASLPKGQGCVVALAFDGDIPLRVDVLRGVVPDISVGGLRVTYASEAVADVPAAVAALLPTAGANGQQRALARGLTFGARLGTATAGQDLMLTRPPSETAATPAKRGDGGTTPAAPAPDRYRAAICRRELPAAARPGSRVGPCQSRHPRSGGGAASLAARKMTSAIPIVMVGVADPVRVGLVDSLARPGGNITDLSDFNAGVVAKRLERLREVVPSASRVVVLGNPTNPSNPLQHGHNSGHSHSAAVDARPVSR